MLFQSLKPYEILIVDSDSTDKSKKIAMKYVEKFDHVKFYNRPGTRGESRNAGAKLAKGDAFIFVDADCIANAFWIQSIKKSLDDGADVVAGKTLRFGYEGFSQLKRVGLFHKGTDISWPSCNLTYTREMFEKIGGFDNWFKEAEEMDLNYRSVDAGAKIVYAKRAIVYHRGRETLKGWFKQSFWYGFGRKELTVKHGNLWEKYDPVDMVKINKDEGVWKLIRLGIAFWGYMMCKVVKGNAGFKQKMRKSNLSER